MAGDMSMSMICQLLVLASFLGFLALPLMRTASQRPDDVANSVAVVERGGRGLRPPRPPGLTVLCVAIC